MGVRGEMEGNRGKYKAKLLATDDGGGVGFSEGFYAINLYIDLIGFVFGAWFGFDDDRLSSG